MVYCLNHRVSLQFRQIRIKLILAHMGPVPVPLNLFIFDELIEYVIAQCLSYKLTLFHF